ncbi:orotidine 5'-phosphate decarboxylase / HUMPS family protein [Desulfurococcus amylolyticus]|uniref:orotidine 5'-phosphate decarboxylase / HUMPS family protein n=1 Tax=Desulfurococcus amylolyticus TaxID=94694 RepID=UPI0023F20C8F|nr:orotidine 5'-phosphate decarboxylase / HUMPS family protein [Desulfurococcus amylolyticus]
MARILQVALDLAELTKSVDIATKIASHVQCKNIWLEVGTPLLKAWGKIAVKALKNLTNCFILVDTKTIDVPSIEGGIVLDAGGDAFTVLGVADDEVVKEAVETARSRGKLVVADLISHPSPVNRAIELDRLGVDVVLYHVGISVQKARGITATHMLKEIENLRRSISAKIAVAGGIKPGDVRELVSRGVDIIVVGGAITKASNPLEVVDEILGKLSQ